MARAGGLDQILSTRSPAFKQRAHSIRTEDDWLSAMVEEPRLIRRPILVTERGVAVGFNSDAWARLLQ
ncbi:MAG: arsenate reductase [Firmicutes bacterium]|nr:arsenate reductase [Bacillota bacterium]